MVADPGTAAPEQWGHEAAGPAGLVTESGDIGRAGLDTGPGTRDGFSYRPSPRSDCRGPRRDKVISPDSTREPERPQDPALRGQPSAVLLAELQKHNQIILAR